MIVLDASAVVELLRRSPAGAAVGSRLASVPLPYHAPALLDVEVAQVFRRFAAAGSISAEGGQAALATLAVLPVRRHPHLPLLPRVWALRANLTAYDAIYVALAERLGATLVTRDSRLAVAPGHRAIVEVI